MKLSFRHFANVIDLGGGDGLAFCTDGVGTKALVAQMMGKYDTIGIDCVAMNVNDLVCVGADPLSMVDYVAVENADPDILYSVWEGICRGAEIAGISIAGGETALLGDIIKGYRSGLGFDLVGAAVGTVRLDEILVGRDVKPDDVVIGVASNGIHSNGLTLARKVFFEDKGFTIDTRFPELGKKTLGAELLEPTHIYVDEARAILKSGLSVKAMIHITGDGFMNLSRVEAEIGYVINDLPESSPIFELIRKHGKVAPSEMFSVYNMGIGFCVISAPEDADEVLAIARSRGREAWKIGFADAEKPRVVAIPQYNLEGRGKTFYPVNGSLDEGSSTPHRRARTA